MIKKLKTDRVIWIALLALIIFALSQSLWKMPQGRRLLQQWGLVKPPPQISFSTTKLRPGDFFLLDIEPIYEGQSVELEAGFFLEQPRLFPADRGLQGMIPLTYRTKPGSYSFRVKVKNRGEIILDQEQEITVEPRDFAIQKMYVSQELHAKRDTKLWDDDHVFTEQSRSNPVKNPLWEGQFIWPVIGRITTDFGQIRFINDIDSGRHSGLDILAPTGTPILAGNTGVVVLARSLNITGNTVTLDHGFNLFSSYCHLDQINVELGQKVAKGEKLGTAGNTGFSTAPHLHWSISVGKVFVDPYLFLQGDPLQSLPNRR